MTLFLPPIKQVPSPNYSGREAGARIQRIIAHDCEGDYAGSVSWFSQIRSQVSAHLVLSSDGKEVTQMVPLAEKAWHVCAYNSTTIGVEIAGYMKAGFSANELNADANMVAWLLHRYGLPCAHAPGAGGEGFCSHFDTGAAGGGHLDLTTDPTVWAAFQARVEAAYAALAALPAIPDWALHGLPAPTAVALPPPAPAGFVPSGTIRKEWDDAPAHVTTSGWPLGSTADLQWRLNWAGASPRLAVDGLAGPLTRAAITAFQGKHGLFVDGLIGPLTWVALEKAS